jgi:hypothetical protein
MSAFKRPTQTWSFFHCGDKRLIFILIALIATASTMTPKQCRLSPWIWLLPLALVAVSIVPIVLSAANRLDIGKRHIEYDYYRASHGAYQYNCTIIDIRDSFVGFILVDPFCIYAWTQSVPPAHNHGLRPGHSPCWTYEKDLCAPNSMSIVPNLEDTSDYISRQRLNMFMYVSGWIGVSFGLFSMWALMFIWIHNAHERECV